MLKNILLRSSSKSKIKDLKPEFHFIFDKMITLTHEQSGTETLAQAKEEFFLRTGKAFPEDAFYDQRVNYFLNHFIFEQQQKAKEKVEFSFLNSSEFSRVMNFRHSIFKIVKKRDDLLVLEDLFEKKKKYLVVSHHDNLFKLIHKGELLQTFLFQLADGVYELSDGHLVHPKSARRIVLKYIKLKQQEALQTKIFEESKILFYLAYQHMRHLRHPHVPAKQIYQSEPRQMTQIPRFKAINV